jgi:hypothetical protein
LRHWPTESACTRERTSKAEKPRQTFYFFARKNKLRGTICFLGGIALVFCRYPFWGMLIEGFGFLNLFGSVQALLLEASDAVPSATSFRSSSPSSGKCRVLATSCRSLSCAR